MGAGGVQSLPLAAGDFFRAGLSLTDGYDYSRYKATLEAIEWFRSEPVEGTAETVDAALLDGLGRYKRQSA